MSLSIEEITILVLILINIVLCVTVLYLNHRVNRLFGGKKNVKSFEEAILSLKKDIEILEDFKKNNLEYLENVEKRIKSSMRGLHTVRFNPFKGNGSGGNQSFATAIVNEDGDGVILSSLYSREHVSVFSKPINKHSSEFELTDEEKEALNQAKAKL